MTNPPSESGPALCPATYLRRCRERLDTALQPIFDLQTGAAYGVEALTRGWARIGYDSAPALFDAAASFGVLEELETSRMEAAVVTAERLALPATPHLFVNIDTRLLLRSIGLVDRLEAAARRVGRPLRLITVELSERHEKSLQPKVAERISEIRRRGFQLALDDFGVGVSDMRSLHDFDIDVMKIDRFFAHGIADDLRKRFLVGQMIELAHLLGQKVVVEGLERVEDLQVCRELGADLGQGYLLGRPETDLSALRCCALRFGSSDLKAKGDGAPGEIKQAVRQELQQIKPVHFAQPLAIVVELFRRPEHPPHCPVVGDLGEPMGVVKESDLRRYAYSPFGLDLLANRSQPIRIVDIMRRYPTAQSDTDPNRLSELLTGSDCDGILITHGMRYAGFLPAAALLRLSHARSLAAAQDANPLTGLPGNRMVSAFLDSAKSEGAHRAVCYFDFDHFKPFNDVYGFQNGDRAIFLFAVLLKKEFASSDSVCHIGGDDFFVGASCSDTGRAAWAAFRERVLTAASCVRERFSYEVESLYSAEDRASGGILARDRRDPSRSRRFPLLSCSVGVIFAPEGAAPSINLLASEIAEIKKRSKAAPSGLAVTDLSPTGEDLLSAASERGSFARPEHFGQPAE